jgi:soluble lytic murein transglycosylase-like protein
MFHEMKYLTTGTLVAAVILLSTAFTMSVIDLKYSKAKIKELQTQAAKPQPQPKDKRMEISAAWVARHSERISEVAAKHVADEVFKYPNPILILSLIEAESEFTPTAISNAGAIGLGQIMYYIHKKDLADLGIAKRKDLFDIEKNIKATSFILQMMLIRNNSDVTKALHSYLGGKDGKYVSRIFSNYVQLSMEIEGGKS